MFFKTKKDIYEKLEGIENKIDKQQKENLKLKKENLKLKKENLNLRALLKLKEGYKIYNKKYRNIKKEENNNKIESNINYPKQAQKLYNKETLKSKNNKLYVNNKQVDIKLLQELKNNQDNINSDYIQGLSEKYNRGVVTIYRYLYNIEHGIFDEYINKKSESSERARMSKLVDEVKILEEKYNSKAPLNVLEDTMEEKYNMNEEEVEELIKNLTQRGIL